MRLLISSRWCLRPLSTPPVPHYLPPRSPAYILAMALAATLHASSTALPATEESSFTIEKKASPGINQLSDGDGGRILRRVEQYATNEKGVEEERIYTKMRLLFNQAMHAAKVKSNGKDAGYLAALLARLRKEGK